MTYKSDIIFISSEIEVKSDTEIDQVAGDLVDIYIRSQEKLG